ncbi:hypothetical protein C1X35_07215 [Pseudomonas sp. FW306-1C-G01A]|nr:hypothetical protein C1X51_29765 [Pseudomonas sp. FW306-2-2C-B10A]PMV88595.1 hypothetical protein C1X56_06800 [Pseudomonas sp. GW101-1A09]PMV98963.1 hypothetical protein C1X55_13935 [Pseudomonas sp. GW460-C8]PMW06407.1 hypothetical protein C1X50_09220 [Pseudomonas sp. MPR-TSA4]PMW12053.1 hypothetical protein C1X52_19985 [Pseudomonas sp. FW306-2-1A-C05A]PMW14287.1 hypothetical protein C1X40_22900 [Pseudomonas sp. GW456-11-11-14-TSB2]PMW22650.1 hypothetical protein C1X53_14205 [Pseudomonas s
MNLRRSALQIHLSAKKPYQSASDHRRQASYLIRINSVFLSLFCFGQGFYSGRHASPGGLARLCNRGSIDHEHSNNRTGL